jgi:hypothetical protein
MVLADFIMPDRNTGIPEDFNAVNQSDWPLVNSFRPLDAA